MTLSGQRLALRTRLLWTVMVAVAAALVLSTVGFNLLLRQGLARDANALVRSRAVVEADTIDVVAGRVTPEAAPDSWGLDSEAWTFVADKKVDGPVASTALELAARRVAATPTRIVEVPAEHVRMYATPVVVDGKRVAIVVAGVSMRPYENTARLALIGSLVLAGALLVVLFLVTRWGLAAALRPVAEMTAEAEAWSLEGADRRFAAGEPHDELGRLAATLDGLMDRVAASLRREQRFSAELSHELRTPLAKISAEAELALRREREPDAYRAALQIVLANAQTMSRTIDTLVTAQRHRTSLARGSADPGTVLDATIAANAEPAAARGLDLTATAAQPGLRVGVEADVVAQILQPLVENACRHAASRITLGVVRHGGEIRFTIDDDGPGVPPASPAPPPATSRPRPAPAATSSCACRPAEAGGAPGPAPLPRGACLAPRAGAVTARGRASPPEPAPLPRAVPWETGSTNVRPEGD
jgi:two-component system, OmpR family, sensor kinase